MCRLTPGKFPSTLDKHAILWIIKCLPFTAPPSRQGLSPHPRRSVVSWDPFPAADSGSNGTHHFWLENKNDS